MSFRYGIELIPEPSFVARAYRARQLICGQYGSWAAEMFMVHLTVADFFQCPESAVDAIDAGLGKVAEQSRRVARQFSLSHQGVATFPGGTIHLDFATPERAGPLYTLHRNVISLLQQLQQALGIVPNLQYALDKYWPHLTLMQYAKLPEPVFEDAVQFARAVVADLQVPVATQAWKLILIRFESHAAGDNWDDGRWAADLRWSLLSSHSL